MRGTSPEEDTGRHEHKALLTPEAAGQASTKGPGSRPAMLLTAAETAELMGVGERMIRRLVAERRLGFVKIGRWLRFRPEDIVKYQEEHYHPPRR
jgi:excisionase family DNA binding protein